MRSLFCLKPNILCLNIYDILLVYSKSKCLYVHSFDIFFTGSLLEFFVERHRDSLFPLFYGSSHFLQNKKIPTLSCRISLICISLPKYSECYFLLLSEDLLSVFQECRESSVYKQLPRFVRKPLRELDSFIHRDGFRDSERRRIEDLCECYHDDHDVYYGESRELELRSQECHE